MVYQFWIPFVVLFVAVSICEHKWCMLRDVSGARPQPYSWARVQLAWWTVIILSSFVAVLWKSDVAPTLAGSTLVLLGISSLTTAAARLVDVSDETSPAITRHQDEKSETFFLDILSDQNGVSISRFQALVFNLVFGIWMITKVVNNLGNVTVGSAADDINGVIPVIEPNNLVLLGLSSATYAALKVTENKEKKAQEKQALAASALEEEPLEATEPAVG